MQEIQEMLFWSLHQEDPLEKEMATHSSILPWRIQWTEEPGRLQSMGLQRVRHDWAHTQNKENNSQVVNEEEIHVLGDKLCKPLIQFV